MDGTRRPLTREERRGEAAIPPGKNLPELDNLTSQGITPTGTIEFEFNGKRFHPGQRNHWKTTIGGMHSLVKSRRIQESTNQIQYVRFFDDFPVQPISNLWTDTTQTFGFVDAKLYVVQTLAKVVERCLLMTTSHGDLVLDPTCGSVGQLLMLPNNGDDGGLLAIRAVCLLPLGPPETPYRDVRLHTNSRTRSTAPLEVLFTCPSQNRIIREQ